MTDTQRIEIDEIVQCILSSVKVSEIYLFGSFADGTARKDSDFDFYVVIPDDSELREIETQQKIGYSLINKQKRSIDMLVGKQTKFNKRKNYFYSIENEVSKNGVKLYG
jgi:predicted nucleotidyltransferase